MVGKVNTKGNDHELIPNQIPHPFSKAYGKEAQTQIDKRSDNRMNSSFPSKYTVTNHIGF